MKPAAPQSEKELEERVNALAGYSLEELALAHRIDIPSNMLHAKGFAGQFIEYLLGATAQSKPLPDFLALNIELKTLPLNARGLPQESTYVCHIPLKTLHEETWHTSLVRRKLKKVCWLPIDGNTTIPLAKRRIGQGFLWTMDPDCEKQLQHDWEELTDAIVLGELDTLSAKRGKYLQVRPKAANSRSLTEAFAESGEKTLTLPRGFYLRTQFTAQLLKNGFPSP